MITASTLRAEVHARAPVESLVPILVCRVMGAHMLHSVCTSLAQCFTAQGSMSLRRDMEEQLSTLRKSGSFRCGNYETYVGAGAR